MPTYYIMEANFSMRENIARAMKQQPSSISLDPSWLTDDALSVYVSEYTRTTFRGGLNWYKISTNPSAAAELEFLAGAKISVPMKFVSGKLDWGSYQEPGALEAMATGLSVRKDCYRGTVMVDGAGHWVNMEQADTCVDAVLSMAKETE
jgi:pimeloyl-ACP methyl ester carboxylesterase